ncbi:MAG: dihydrofolate reductase family protein [Thermoanaerobaculia bacterium]|nr:dihydrofolate reductase family protein [Thermoanaerobaculia bacterium]
MRPVVYSVAMSLDGFIAGPDDDYDWIPVDVGIDWEAFLHRFDTSLVGGRSFEMTRRAPEAALPGNMRHYVFSQTHRQEDHPDVTIVSENGAEVVRGLREEEGKEIWLFGGGELFASLLADRVVDVVELALVPILLGDGRPFMKSLDQRVRLELEKTTPLEQGVVLLRYRVEGT